MSSSQSQAHLGRLRRLTPRNQSLPSSNAPINDLNLILIRDVNGDDSQWKTSLSSIQSITPQTNVYAYDCTLKLGNELVWDHLEHLGDLLVDLMRAEFTKLTSRGQLEPLILWSFGYGGSVAKRAFNRMHQHMDFFPLVQALKGMVFFAVPHPTYHRKDKWPKLITLLRTVMRLDKKQLLAAEQYCSRVAKEAEDFEVRCIDVPVLTIYETKPTKVPKALWFSTKILLVGRDFSEIVTNKQSIENDTDYFKVGNFEKAGPIFAEITDLLILAHPNVSSHAETPDEAQNQLPTLNMTPASSGQGLTSRPARPRWASTESDANSEAHNDSAAGDALNIADNSSGRNRLTTPDHVAAGTSDFSSYERINEFMAPKKVPAMPCYVRRPYTRNPNFIGRDDVMTRIDEALLPSTTSSSDAAEGLRLFSICGFGGLGKTQIAVQYSFQREGVFDGIFIIQADTSEKLNKSFDQIAKALGLADRQAETDSIVYRNLVLEWLTDPRKVASTPADNSSITSATSEMARWLLIFENADDLTVLNEIWTSIIELPTGSILITSRDPLAKTVLTSDVGIHLEEMTPSDCAKLIRKLAPEANTERLLLSSARLAERIGGIPLAVSQITALIQRKRMTIDEFLSQYGESSLLAELQKMKDLPTREQYKKTLSSVWDFEKFSVSTLCLINILVFLDPDEIAETILQQKASDSVLQHFPTSGDPYITARTELLSTSLVNRNIDAGTLSLHRLVQEVGRDKLDANTARSCYAFAIQLLHNAWAFQEDRFNREDFRRQGAEQVIDHVSALLPRYHELGAAYLTPEQRRQFATLLSESAWYLVQRIEYETAGPVLSMCLSICEEHESELEDLLGDTLFASARYGEEINMQPTKVFEYCQRYYNLCQNRNDGSRARLEDLATSSTSLAQGYLLLDDWDSAIKYCKECIDLDAQLPEAWALYGKGEYDAAAILLTAVISFRLRRFGPNDQQSPKHGFALHLLGNVRSKQGKKGESFDMFLKALANFEITQGKDSFRVGQVCLKLAEHHASEFQVEAAKGYFAQARRIFEMHPYYQHELARTYYLQATFVQEFAHLTGGSSVNEDLFDKAKTLYYKLLGQPVNDSASLGMKDFDQLVRFWSR